MSIDPDRDDNVPNDDDEPKDDDDLDELKDDDEPKDDEPKDDEKKDDEKKDDDDVVTRYEIRSMSSEMQKRFVMAVKKLQENSDGPETSEWFRIAGYHGWPGKTFCVHGKEAFPAWHRAYLVELELALRKADKENGNDGKIGLPYWDWNIESINGEVYPKILVEHLYGLPAGFLKDKNCHRLKGKPGKEIKFPRYPLKRIIMNMKRSKLGDKAQNCLEEAQHWKAASMRWRGDSVETPHNNVHVNCGFPMASVKFAAFDTTFWLHHCNVDRLYEAYITEHPDSKDEYKAQQGIMHENRGSKDLYEAALKPFKFKGGDFLPKHTFNTEKIGYKYDKVLKRRPKQMREVPTYAVFKDIDIMQLNGNSYILYVFVMHKNKKDDFKIPDDMADWDECEEFAGTGAVFGRGPGCENCETRDPFVETVDITATLNKLGLARSQAAVLAMTFNQDGEAVLVEETPIPNPVIEGPYFQTKDDMLSLKEEIDEQKEGGNAFDEDDCRNLQRLLKKYGWYEGELTGKYDKETAAAVVAFQTRRNLKTDGVFGPLTKESLMATRFDDKQDNLADSEDLIYEPSTEVFFWVGTNPGYMKRDDVLNEISSAINQWGEALTMTFTRTDDKSKSTLNLSWGDQSGANDFLFDGKGGELARGGVEGKVGFVQFDLAEKWYTQPQKDKAQKGDFAFAPVVLHEVGHCFGLGHVEDPSQVMSPYYVADRIKLTEGDINHIKQLYKIE